MQRCADLTPCSPRYLDCSKGPNRCVCEVFNQNSKWNPASNQPFPDIKTLANQVSSLSFFETMANDPQMADFMSMLVKSKPMTLFVPTTEAFQRLGGDPSLQMPKEILKHYWIPNDALLTADLLPTQMVMNANGQMLKVSKENGVWMVDGVRVILADLRVQNGLVIWVIDQINPKSDITAVVKPRTTSFFNLGNNQGAQANIPSRPMQSWNNAQEHVNVKSIPERIAANPLLTTFGFLLNDPRYAEVMQMLTTEGPVTVFVPTNEAFSKEGIDTTNVAAMKELMKHHIVPKTAALSSDFVPSMNMIDAQGDKLKIARINGVWMVDNAKILVSDIQAKNGVIFLIDSVLQHTQGTRAGQSASKHSDWHGAGLYCAAQNDLYYCNENADCILQETCKQGCVRAQSGLPDYCFVDLPGKVQAFPPGFVMPNGKKSQDL